MEINNNLNSMYQLEQQLNKSATNVAQTAIVPDTNNVQDLEIDLVKEMVNQIMIPIAYTANAEVISTQSSTSKTLLDIKA
jgi:flagellar basal body rod protein FlgC